MHFLWNQIPINDVKLFCIFDNTYHSSEFTTKCVGFVSSSHSSFLVNLKCWNHLYITNSNVTSQLYTVFSMKKWKTCDFWDLCFYCKPIFNITRKPDCLLLSHQRSFSFNTLFCYFIFTRHLAKRQPARNQTLFDWLL